MSFAPDRPNVLLILVDEMRADALGCFGGASVGGQSITPNLDRLAAEGTRFSSCFVPQPTCTPCRAALLTGCYASALRSRMVGCHTPDDARFLPRVLGRAGYRTASVGKIHLVPQRGEAAAIEATRRDDATVDYFGFETIELVNGHGPDCFGPSYTPWLRGRVADLDERRAVREPMCGIPSCYRWPLPPEVHSTRYIADHAVESLRHLADDRAPFLLHCSFPDPHHPFCVPEPYASRFDPDDMPDPLPPITEAIDPPPVGVAAYEGRDTRLHRPDGCATSHVIGTPHHDYRRFSDRDWRVVRAVTAGMVAMLDDAIGRVLDTLDELGLADRTVVAFASDHGDYLGDHGMFGKGLHYDSVLRTPLLLRGPGVPRGRVADGIASLVDLAPTLYDLLGVDEPEALQGFSLKPGLDDSDAWPRDAALTENDDDIAGLRMRTLTTRYWKLTRYAGDDFGELYDRRADPGERRNRYADPACRATRDTLNAALADHLLCASDGANGRVQPPKPRVVKHRPAPVCLTPSSDALPGAQL
ncbi:MAG: sulfatase-like hydrolase/transferase [Planctomycetota bacterium]